MKKNKLYNAVVMPVLTMVLLNLACGSGPAPEKEAGTVLWEETVEADLPSGYRLRKFNLSAPLSEKPAKGDPRVTITLTLLEVQEPAHEAKFLNDILYSGNGPERYRDALAREYQDMYRHNPPPEDLLPSASFAWEHLEQTEVLYPRERGMALEREIYTFTGGAHGMRTKTYYVIDMEQQKVLSLGDFFRDPGGAEARCIVKEELRRYSGLKNDQPLSEGIFFEDEPEISANFFVNQEGLGLHWDPYEIAPYYAGYVEIILPWRTIRPLLKHEGMDLLTKFGIYLFVS